MITCEHLTFSYLNNTNVIDDFCFEFAPHTRTTLVGPNGCGKSTLLRIITGLLSPTQGVVLLDRSTTIGYISQSYKDSLFPWLSIEKNLVLPLTVQGINKVEARDRVLDMLSAYLPTIDASRLPGTLSGGQQQLLCILRALVLKSNVFILDEPFSALDSYAKQMLYEILKQVYRDQGITILMVTHDLQEALYLSQTTLLLSKVGLHIEQEIIY